MRSDIMAILWAALMRRGSKGVSSNEGIFISETTLSQVQGRQEARKSIHNM
jgi:hypothetical protein